MSLLHIEFNIVNIILATFIFGLGDDYTIFITEGMMYEYARGKKMLGTYKNTVALSALIMLAGIGSLIVAQHPAMRPLAEITILGMVSVVITAYVLPPTSSGKLVTKRERLA
jgi:predicted RND superfamily exporter protein